MKPLRLPAAQPGLADIAILCLLGGVIAAVVAFAREFQAPFAQAVQIDLRPAALPRYTLYSLSRGVTALVISYLFALAFCWATAKPRAAARLLLSLPAFLRSIPVLGFGFRLGDHDYRLPGIGSFMSVALDQGNVQAMALAIAAMVIMIVCVDQLLWRPLVVWVEKFRLDESSAGEAEPSSWVLDFLRRARLPRRAALLQLRAYRPARPAARPPEPPFRAVGPVILRGPRLALEHPVARKIGAVLAIAAFAAAAALGMWRLWLLLAQLGWREWSELLSSAALTFVRVMGSVIVATAWTLPAGVWIGRSPRIARALQPVIQVVASFPAPMLFPLVILLFERIGIGLGLGAVALMVLAGQWYILFNVISAVAAIPGELKEAAAAFR